MNRRTLIQCTAGALALVLTSCGGSSRTGDDWYEYSKNIQTREDEYVSQQVEHGATEVQAKQGFALEHAIERTTGVEPVVLEGDALKDRLEP